MIDSPVITIDGPSGSGKGTISYILAQKLGWHLLDSGALYRVLGLAATLRAIKLDDIDALQHLAEHLDVQFKTTQDVCSCVVALNGDNVSQLIRTEDAGKTASIIAAIPQVREALLARQKAFKCSPGLVADGRDMGTVVFAEAPLKIFLTASAEERAKRRYNQLNDGSYSGSLRGLLQEILKRDDRDANRSISPLIPAQDAIVLDSTSLSIDEVCAKIMVQVNRCNLI